ncbi:MAG: hypothetical protein E2598_10300 [Sphingobium sp.]|nr:hypothetical protein [Sphingobium sp.]
MPVASGEQPEQSSVGMFQVTGDRVAMNRECPLRISKLDGRDVPADADADGKAADAMRRITLFTGLAAGGYVDSLTLILPCSLLNNHI